MNQLSIIVPIYNNGKSVLNSIKSLCQQTDQDFELILVNDGSSDDSVEIAEDFLNKANRKYSIIRQENRGQAAARNAGTKAAHGEWITWLDADDEFAVNTIENIKAVFSSNADAIFLGYTNSDFSGIVSDVCVERMSGDDLRDDFLFRKKGLLAPGTFLKKDFLLANNLLYQENFRYSEDIDFLWRLLLRGNQWTYLNGFFYHYVVRQNSIMNGGSSVEKILSGIKGAMAIDISNSDYKYKEYICPRWVLGLLHSAARQLSQNDFQRLISSFDYHTQMKKLRYFPNSKTLFSSKLLLLSPRAFYFVARHT